MPKIFIIAEAGVNHNGSLALAKKLIDVAARAGADAVKFQTFKAESLVSRSAAKADYQKKYTDKNETQLQMIKRLELSVKAHHELIKYCRTKKIMFLSSAFDMQSIELLADLGMKIFKIPSGEITNLPYLRRIGSLRKQVIMSTGMATLPEISEALNVLIKSGTRKQDITVLHCNTEYPTPMKDVNLSAMITIKQRLGIKVGYSDHTVGIEIPIAASALGASVIEKHFTLDKSLPGPDQAASLDPVELKEMIAAIRHLELAMGDGIKKVSASERKNMTVARKSIIAARDIAKGELFSEANLCVKRPGHGISPMKWDELMGKRAKRAFKQDDLIK